MKTETDSRNWTNSKQFTFKKTDRILKRPEYKTIQKNGKVKRSNAFFIYYWENPDRNRTRIGITASKYVGRAVKRNRIKRLAREYFRLNRHIFKDNLHNNIIVKRKTASLTNDQVLAELKQLLSKISPPD